MCYNRMNISVQEVLLLKRTILALLICALLATVFTPAALGEEEGLYNAVVTRRFQNSTTKIYSEMDTESKVLKWCNPGHKLVITKVFPNWVEVKYGSGVGYVLRLRVDVEEAIDPVNTPPYGVEFNQYYTVIDQPTQVYADKNRESEVLSTLTKGAKVGSAPETAEDPAQWGIAVLGPNTRLAENEVVPAKTMLDKTHQGV